jgi:hypothetical protein
VPYSRISVTQFSPHALRGIKNKKSEECIEIINLNIPHKALIPFTAWGLKRVLAYFPVYRG